MPVLDSAITSGVQMAWLAPALCVTSFMVLAIFGRLLPRWASVLSLLAISGAFVVFCYVLFEFLSIGSGKYEYWVDWFRVGKESLSWGMIIDELSILMLGLVTFVAMMVQVYSIGYMKEEDRLTWYFAVQSLFAASMLTLVLANNLLFMYIAWELVGACSYLLIGFWYERRSAAEAAKKAFVTTRIGDVGLLIGILLIFKVTGTFEISEIIHIAANGGVSSGTLTIATLLIFMGAMGKSAQFPFHIWLPDAMEGPTPVSALIHAATMVVSGVYLVARLFPLFMLTPDTLLVVAIIGLITAILAASMALVMTDLKKVLAYSTVSHLGLMMVSLGLGGFTAGMFHLLTHGFAKALLFLGAGSVDHGTGGKRDIRELGGLWRRMPITTITFSIGALALGGIPPLSGFFSKDEIMLVVLNNGNPVFIVLTILAVLMSALYMARILLLVFLGPLKTENRDAHESPLVMTVPLLALSFLAVTAGFLAFGWSQYYEGFGSFLFYGHPEKYHFDPVVISISTSLSLVGFGLGWAIYAKRWLSAEAITSKLSPLHRWASNKYYIDDLCQWCIDHIALTFSTVVAVFDRIVINDTIVNGTGQSTFSAGFKLRYIETGKIYNYAFGMVAGMIIVAITWWLGFPYLDA